MFHRLAPAFLLFLICTTPNLFAPEGEKPPAADTPSRLLELPTGGSFGAMVQSAGDMRAAAESLERFGQVLDRIVPIASEAVKSLGESQAAMSREFDPFGFKEAQRTLQQQNEIIARQQELIQDLLREENERLRAELERVRRLKSARKRQSPPK